MYTRHTDEHSSTTNEVCIEHEQKIPLEKLQRERQVGQQRIHLERQLAAPRWMAAMDGELDDDLRSKRCAERLQVGKGGLGSAAHRTL